MTEVGYRALFGLYQTWARRHCRGRIVYALEGGYDLAGIVAGVRAGLLAMTGGAPAGGRTGETPAAGDLGEPSEAARRTASRVRLALSPYWGL